MALKSLTSLHYVVPLNENVAQKVRPLKYYEVCVKEILNI